jgi:hypothetical protein
MTRRPPTPGAIVGDYRLHERIGGGGMGSVHRGEHVATGRAVAIKLLHAELAENEELTQRLLQEARAVDRIQHPNVVHVLDVGISDLGPYLVMEHLDGESVGTALARTGRFGADAAIATALPVLEALGAAHAAGIVHRDLKPENVFLVAGESPASTGVRLLDFGVAKVLDPALPSLRTRTGVVFGTPDYLSPEQATGEGPLDGRSDLFAIGVLLYELLTGTRPFRAPTPVATAFRVVHLDPPPPSAAVGIDAHLEAVVMRLLRKKPAERFANAREVAIELEGLAPAEPRRAIALDDILRAARARASAGPAAYAAPRQGDPRGAAEAVLPFESGARPPVGPTSPARFHVLGAVLESIDRAVSDTFGTACRDVLLQALGDPHARRLKEGTFDPRTTCELDAIERYLAAATATLSVDRDAWRDAGRAAVAGGLSPQLRPLMAGESGLGAAARRAVKIWARLFSFGTWRVATRAGGVELEVCAIDRVSASLRAWIVGMVEQTLRRATASRVQATVGSGAEPGEAALRIEIR